MSEYEIYIRFKNPHGVFVFEGDEVPPATAWLERAPFLTTGPTTERTPGVEFTGPTSVVPTPPGPEDIEIFIERANGERDQATWRVTSGSDEARVALFDFAARVASRMDTTPPYRTARAGDLVTVIPHLGGAALGVAKFTLPALLREVPVA